MKEDTINSLKNERKVFSTKIAKLQAKVDAINTLLSTEDQLITDKELTFPKGKTTFPKGKTTFPKGKTIAHKIEFTLSQIGESTAKEIANYILEHDDSVNRDTIHQTVTLITSSHSKEGTGNITVKGKNGRSNIYGLLS